jgi:anti-anti-sigma factor
MFGELNKSLRIVAPKGKLDGENANAKAFQDSLKVAVFAIKATPEEHRVLGVDLSEVTYMDSRPLEDLLKTHIELRELGVPVELLNPSTRLKEFLGMINFARVFPIRHDLDLPSND